jgi:hypothetical protein
MRQQETSMPLTGVMPMAVPFGLPDWPTNLGSKDQFPQLSRESQHKPIMRYK